MANSIQVQKTLYNKEEYNKVVDREFNFFIDPVNDALSINVEEFFVAYDNLYLEIPLQGSTNSHEYLIRRSSELVDYTKDTQDIEPLLDEIAQLRQQLLEANQQIFELQQSSITYGGN